MVSPAPRHHPLRILMLAPEPFFTPRGTPFSVLHRLRALSRLGHRVDLVTYPLGEDVAVPGCAIHRARRVPGVRRVPIGPSWAKVPLDISLLASAVGRLLRQRYDVIHSHEEAAFFGIVLAWIFRTRHLYDMHSSLPQQLANFRRGNWWPLRALFRWGERQVLTRSNAIITICPDLAARARACAPATPQVLIENVALDEALASRWGESPEALKSEYGLTGRPVIVYAGTFEPYQGLDLLLASASLVLQRHPEALFVLVGGTPDQVELYQGQARERGLDGCVRFTGALPPAGVSGYLRAADLLVSPRTAGTNTPLKIYAYLAVERPIVATRIPSHTQVLTAEVAALPEATPEAFAEAICALLEDPARRATLARQGATLARTHYSYDSYLRRTRDLYQALIGGGV